MAFWLRFGERSAEAGPWSYYRRALRFRLLTWLALLPLVAAACGGSGGGGGGGRAASPPTRKREREGPQRLALLITLTIPVFELTVVEWVTVQQAAKEAAAQEAVSDATNTALQGFAAATAEAIPEIARTIQTPSLSPETITLVAQSISDQLQGITDAVQYGIEARKGVDDAIVTAPGLLAKASDDESAKIINLVADSTTTPAPPPLPQLPAAVVDKAPELLAS